MTDVNTLNTFTAPRLISIKTGDRVERFEVDFVFPELDRKNTQKLALDIKDAGRITMPIIVMPSTVEGYVIIDGWHRYHIAKELQLDCPALLFENLAPQEAQELFLSENLSRRQMTKDEKKQLAIDLREKYGWDTSSIARLLGIHFSTVSRWFKPADNSSILKYLTKLNNAIERITEQFVSPLFNEQMSKQDLEGQKQALSSMFELISSVRKFQEAA